MDDPVGVSMTIAAPLTDLDYQILHEQLPAVSESAWHRLLLEVDSVGIDEPRVLWDDLRLAPLMRHMHAVAVVTDVTWFARLSEISGALLPGLTITHFSPPERKAAVEWLGTFTG